MKHIPTHLSSYIHHLAAVGCILIGLHRKELNSIELFLYSYEKENIKAGLFLNYMKNESTINKYHRDRFHGLCNQLPPKMKNMILCGKKVQ